MLSFENDYSAGAHPVLLQRLLETNMMPASGYGRDEFCAAAKEKIKEACKCPHAEVYFLVGGTQTNQIVIATMLKMHEGVIAAQTGHVSLHEAGAIEYTGHEVLTLPQHDGKIDAKELDDYIETFYNDDNHEIMMTYPGMAYISHPTENGTLYTKAELTELSKVCRKHNIPLYLDGARLGYGLMSRDTDVSLADIAELCDVFYIGGTKIGALCGEAVVFTKGNMPKYMPNHAKKHGALLAKGRLLGVQFDALFTDGLYFDISRHAIDMAEKVKTLLKEKGFRFAWESPTNQQFVIMENAQFASLKKQVAICFWEKYDENHTVVRFATSWATTEEDVEKLSKIL